MNSEPRSISSGSPGDEAQLVRAAQAGEAKAFAEIVRRYQRAMYRVAYGFVRSPADADDVAQETFVRAFQASAAGQRAVYPGLAHRLQHRAVSFAPKAAQAGDSSSRCSRRAAVGTDDDPLDRVAAAEQARHLREAMAELKPEHQAVLVLRVVEDLSYEEIAKALSVPPGTVMPRSSRARAELKSKPRPHRREDMSHLTPEELSARFDDALTPARAAETDRHLASCEICRAALAELAAQDDALGRVLSHDPGEAYFGSFAARVEDRIRAAGMRGAQAKWEGGLRSWLRSPRRLAMAGVVAAVPAARRW
jgi:RNA polymerase sigma-70 factor (ECF subfamily)